MNVTYTPAGSPVIAQSEEEYDAYLERQVRREVGMSATEFRDAYLAGRIDDAHPATGYLVGLLRIGQDGHRPVA